jgi:hypothetical protein
LQNSQIIQCDVWRLQLMFYLLFSLAYSNNGIIARLNLFKKLEEQILINKPETLEF